MADLKISALTSATTPLAGTEVLPLVQSSTTKKVAVSDLTAGRAVAGLSFTATKVGNDAFIKVENSGGGAAGAWVFADSVDLNYMGTVLQSAGVEKWFAGSYGTSAYQITNGGRSGTEVLRVETTNDVKVSAGNLVIGTSGKGIDFSATAGTGTSELLADYEEGNWTPSVTASSGALLTVGTVTGKYTKTGNVVTLFGRVTITLNGTGSGSIVVAGLPYSPSTSVSAYSGYGRERSVSGKQLQVDFNSAGSSFDVYNYDNTYPASNGATLIFTVLYIAA